MERGVAGADICDGRHRVRTKGTDPYPGDRSST
jgi:hypothetical protein